MTQTKENRSTPVAVPPGLGAVRVGEVVSVDLGPNDEVEWIWTHDPIRGSTVTGYRIVPRGDAASR